MSTLFAFSILSEVLVCEILEHLPYSIAIKFDFLGQTLDFKKKMSLTNIHIQSITVLAVAVTTALLFVSVTRGLSARLA